MKILILATLACSALLFPAAAEEKELSSRVVIQIHPMHTAAPTGPNFANNQIAILQTGNIIKQAAQNLRLDSKTLKSALKVSSIQGTDLVKIETTLGDSTLGKKALQEIINAYSVQTAERHAKFVRAQFAALDEEHRSQNAIVRKKKDAIAALIQEHGIPQKKEEKLLKTKKWLETLTQHQDQLSIQIGKLKEPNLDERIRIAARSEFSENLVTRLYENRLEAQRQHDINTAMGLGPKHPSMIALEMKIQTLHDECFEETEILKDLLGARRELIKKQINKAEDEIAQNPASDAKTFEAIQLAYREMNKEYDDARELLKKVKLRQQEQRLQLTIPTQPVTIHEWSE